MRLINPSVLVDGRLIPADELSEKVREMNDWASERSKHGIYIKATKKSKQCHYCLLERFELTILLFSLEHPSIHIFTSVRLIQ